MSDNAEVLQALSDERKHLGEDSAPAKKSRARRATTKKAEAPATEETDKK